MHKRPAVLGSILVLLLSVSPALAAEASGAGAVWLAQPSGCAVRVSAPPQMDREDPLSDPVWRQAEPIGLLSSRGQPELADRVTEVRMVVHNATLYVLSRCSDPQADRIARGSAGQEVWQADSVELLVTQSSQPTYPYINLQLNAGGFVSLTRYVRPSSRHDQAGTTEAIDPAVVRVRAGVTSWGWWVVAALPMDVLGLPRDRFYGNVMRNRVLDGSDPAWRDLWSGWSQRVDRFGRIDIVDEQHGPRPRVQLPTSLAVGVNRLTLLDWRAGDRLTVNGAPVDVAADGVATLRIARHGSVLAAITDAQGTLVGEYRAEVPRPLIVEAAQPFQADATAPVSATVWLATVEPTDVTVEARQGERRLGQIQTRLTPGEHTIAIPIDDVTPGEVQLVATATVSGGSGEPLRLSAEHWCAVGQDQAAYDRFREGIDDLTTLSLYRAGLADACNVYHFLQAGDGRYRSFGRRGELGFSEWSYGLCYGFALLYKSDWPENPYRGDRRFLASAVAGMETAVDPATWYAMLEHPPNRHLQAYLLTYDLLKDDVPAEQAGYWRQRLTELVDATITTWITPVGYRTSRFSPQTGTGTNHYAYHAANVYTAGVVLDRPAWRALGEREMLALAEHEQNGQFAERRGVPATHYTWLTMNALGEYCWQSGDARVLPALTRCVEYSCHSSLPSGDMTLLHDGRVVRPSPYNYGDFVLSLTPQGRYLARVRLARHVGAKRRPSQSGPEYWFRTAENALNFRPGEETPLPEDTEFVFLDGRGLIARRSGFLYGLNAISLPPVDERLYWVDPQNAVELHHAVAGPILAAANSQLQPEAGSFHRILADRAVYMPTTGRIERTDGGHLAVLDFDTFTTRLEVEVLSATTVRLVVRLLNAEGDEPVVFSFFPAVARSDDLQVDDDGRLLRFGDVSIKASRPVTVDRDFKIINPYSLKRDVAVKPVRAAVELRRYDPFVLDVTVTH